MRLTAFLVASGLWTITAFRAAPVRTRALGVASRRSVITCAAPAQTKQKLKQKQKYDGGTGNDDGDDDKEREYGRQPTEDLEDPAMFNARTPRGISCLVDVMLLADEDYTQEHVCKALLDVIEDMDIKPAEEIYLQAQKGGAANVCTTSQELAEHYVQQLARKEPMIFCEMREAQ